MNRGSQILARIFEQRGAQVELAAKTGISQSWLSRLASGDAKPNRVQSLTLQAETGIAPDWWDQPPEPKREQGAA